MAAPFGRQKVRDVQGSFAPLVVGSVLAIFPLGAVFGAFFWTRAACRREPFPPIVAPVSRALCGAGVAAIGVGLIRAAMAFPRAGNERPDVSGSARELAQGISAYLNWGAVALVCAVLAVSWILLWRYRAES